MTERIVKLDGGSGVEAAVLYNDIFDINNHPCWSSMLLKDHKDKIAEIHQRFIKSGADIVTTLSYQGDPYSMVTHLKISFSEAEQLLSDSVTIAKAEVGKAKHPVKVAASVGCYGTHLANGSEYTGEYIDYVSFKDIDDLYRSRLKCLTESQPDFIAFETIPTVKEVEYICKLIQEYPNYPVWISLSSPDGKHLAHGEPISEAISVFKTSPENLVGVGVNCKILLANVMSTIKLFNKELKLNKQKSGHTKKLFIYPNGGQIWDPIKREFNYQQNESETTFYDLVPQWLEGGVNYLGGCCGMGSDRMAKVYDKVDKWNHQKMQHN